MTKLVNRIPVAVNIGAPQNGHIPIYNSFTRLWETVSSSSLLAQDVFLDQISGSVFAERTYLFPRSLEVSQSFTASNAEFQTVNINGASVDGVRSTAGSSIFDGVTIWDGQYKTSHSLSTLPGIANLDSAMFSIISQKQYGNVFDDDYYQFLNYVDLRNMAANDNENIYAMVNYIQYEGPYSQSGTIYTFTNAQENFSGYISNVFTNYNISRTYGIGAKTDTATTLLGWVQSDDFAEIDTSYGFRAQVNVTENSYIRKHHQFYGNSNIQSSGSVDELFGLYLTLSGIQESGSITRYAGVAVDQGTITGSNNTYMLLGTDVVPNGNYAIYSDTNYPSWFNGIVSASEMRGNGYFGVLQATDTTTLHQIVEQSAFITGSTPAVINLNMDRNAVYYYTDDATQNWTINFRGSEILSLNDMMETGQTITSAILITNGATAYYSSIHQIDGVPIFPKWQGNTPPSAGTTNSLDVYSYSILKIANATFTVLASKTSFA